MMSADLETDDKKGADPGESITPSSWLGINKKRKKHILTLIGILVVVITLWRPIKYNLIDKTPLVKRRQDEAVLICMNIRAAEDAHYKLNGTYSADPVELGLRVPVGASRYQYEIMLTNENGYEAKVWANIDDDDTVDVWMVSSYWTMPTNVRDDVRE